MTLLCYRSHRFPPEIIQHAIWLYLRGGLVDPHWIAMLCRPGKLGSGSIISIRPNSCGPSARQHRDAPNPHGHPAPWNGEPSGRNRAEPRPLPKKPSRRDRWFESCSLRRGVRCEPDFRGRIPSMAVGDFACTSRLRKKSVGGASSPIRPLLHLRNT